MKFSVSFIPLITIYILPMTLSQKSKPVPGCSACTYYASIIEDCQQPNVPVKNLPQECSSYIYIDVRPNESYNVAFGYVDVNNDEYLKSLIDSGKATFLYFNRLDAKKWLPAVENGAENGKTEIANLKSFLEPYKNIAGLIIGGFNLVPGTTDAACITENLQAYLDEMRACFPDYSIGFDIFGPHLIDFYDTSNSSAYLNFSVLDPYIDYYIVDVFQLNDCTEDFKVGGDVPINGTAFYTMEKVMDYITKLCISKEKIYFFFRPGPKTLVTADDSPCDRTNAKLCASSTLDGFCSDTIQSYYDKGKYAKQYGVGFIAASVDLYDDPYGCCQCGCSYPAFHAMLAGFNGDPAPPTCPLLDKE